MHKSPICSVQPFYRKMRLEVETWARRIAAHDSELSEPVRKMLQQRGPTVVPSDEDLHQVEDPLAASTALMAQAIGLSALEAEVFRFFRTVRCAVPRMCFYIELNNAASMRPRGLAEVLCVALERDMEDMLEVLHPRGKLVRAGIFHHRKQPYTGYFMSHFFNKFSNQLPPNTVAGCFWISRELPSVLKVFSDQGRADRVPLYPVPRIPEPNLKLFDDLAARLENTAAAPTRGLHVLIVGSKPHTDSLCRALCYRLGIDLYHCGRPSKVPIRDMHPYHADQYHMAQAVLQNRQPCFVVADDAPTLLKSKCLFSLNDLPPIPWKAVDFAETCVPTLWPVPSLKVVDPEVMKVFSTVVEL